MGGGDMLQSRTIGVSISRAWKDLYDTIWAPEFFPKWASGLTKAPLQKDGDGWRAAGLQGPIGIRFTEHNAFGVMDHYVDEGCGAIYVPMRVIPNMNGAEVLLTLFRQPEMSDAKFFADAEMMERDLVALKSLVTS